MKMLIILLIATIGLSAEIIVETNDGKQRKYEKIDGSGSLIKLYPKKDASFFENKRTSQIRRIIQPAPALVVLMLEKFDDKKFAALSSSKGARISEKYRNSGWGQLLSYAHGVSLMRSGKIAEARKVLNQGKIYIPGEKDNIMLIHLALVEVLLLEQKLDKAERALKLIKVPRSEYDKVYYYTLQGRILEGLKKSNIAVISYYKAILLGKKHPDRSFALSRIKAVYKAQGDPRTLDRVF